MSAEFGELGFSFTTDDIISVSEDFLFFGFVADLGSAKDELDVGTDALEQGGNLGDKFDVPDLTANADNAGLVRKNLFND